MYVESNVFTIVFQVIVIKDNVIGNCLALYLLGAKTDDVLSSERMRTRLKQNLFSMGISRIELNKCE